MRDPIHDIVQRLALIEGRITPAEPAGDQNPQQKSVNQLPALFKPGKGGPILGGNPDKPAVTKGYFFGAESEEKEEALEEAQANEEKLLDKVKKSLIDYLDSVEDSVSKKKDRDISTKAADRGIGKKAKDKDIVSKNSELEEEQLDEFLPALAGLAGAEIGGAVAGELGAGALDTVLARGAGSIVGRELASSDDEELDEDPTDQEPTTDMPTPAIQEPTYAAATVAPVKTITLEDGRVCEIHGDENSGFEIRHGNRRLPSRFKNLNHATLAMEMFMSRRKPQDASADYIEEA